MKIVIAPDSFKESLSAIEVCNAIEKGFKKILPTAQYIKVPVADGGEGSLDAISQNLTSAEKIRVKVKAHLGNIISANYLINKDTAIIELAQCCGLNLYPKSKRDPLKSNTYGFGQIITDALDKGIRKFILTLGGSGTNDAGIGLLQALGVEFINDKNEVIVNCYPDNLPSIKNIDLNSFDERIKDSEFKIACDVNNILCGKNGATHTFGKQKGLADNQLDEVDKKIKGFAELCKKSLNKDYENVAGVGAAGGVGFALAAFLNAKLVSGAELILETIKFDNYIQNTDILIIGEGKMDKQSLYGKIPITIAQKAKSQKVKKVIAIVGSYELSDTDLDNSAIDAIFSSITYYTDLETILTNAAKNIEQTATNIANIIK
ncbi:glycerate kinase [Francisella sp. 19X1-34]|uniref:glycerate kinase n=1 Tax=Francisella sp. 19X1-34 TaxID=3087177 RepID=UPI002E31F3D1|nr:glycerate kinase [Francisella sp. 19X1-34]MED7789532.1 glycerate kinase [Francisella sp. 19X1-34]